MSEPLRMDARPFLRAIASPRSGALAEWVAARGMAAEWAAWAAAQGLAPYVYHRLREDAALEGVPAAVQARLRGAFYEAAGLSAVQRREAAAVLAALDQAGVEAVLLKGAALACTVYPDPACRLMGDLDLWVQPEQRAAAIAALEAQGYVAHPKADRPPALVALTGGEDQMVGRTTGSGLVEVQQPALRGEWVRRTAAVDHAGMWARRVRVRLEGQAAWILSAEDMLIHICLHLAVNHGFATGALRNLLDAHLIASRLAPDWDAVAARGRAWKLSAVLWTCLRLAADLWGTDLPAAALSALAPPAWQRRALDRLKLAEKILAQHPDGYSHRRFLMLLLLADRPRDAVRLAWRGLFPEGAWLAARYGAATPGALWRARLGHPLRLLITARG